MTSGVWNPETLEAARIVEAEASLHFFVRLMWSAVEPKRKFVDGWLLRAMCEHLEATADGRIKRLILNVPPGSMKALDDATPILTTWGWKYHGDLTVDDFVFGPDGKPKRVVAVGEPAIQVAYEVVFDDGASVIAAGDHLWAIERDYMSVGPKYARGRKPEVVNTLDLRTTGYRTGDSERRPDRIGMSAPLEFPPRRLLVDPYVLGAWLGDGATLSGVLYSGEEDINHFKNLGEIAHVYPPGGTRKQNFYRIKLPGVQEKLRILGLLNNKHIPLDYLDGSIEQRWELLRGLMDTDGTCTTSGSCIFTSKKQALAESVLALLRGLGIKGSCTRKKSQLNGKDYGFHWCVTFTPRAGDIVFKLERKQARCKGHVSQRAIGRYVSSVTPVSERSVRCIQVEGDLYLAGDGLVCTHNSLLTNVFFPAWLWGPKNRPETRFFTASYSSSLTERDNERMRMLVASPEYQSRWGYRFVPGDSKIKFSNNKTGWKLASSVEGVGTGERGDFVLIDDPNDIQKTESAVTRERVQRWLNEVLPTRTTDPEKSVIILIQQRTHKEDATGILLDQMRGGDEWVYFMVSMEYDPEWVCGETPIGWIDPRIEIARADAAEARRDARRRGLKEVDVAELAAKAGRGQLCWPERFPQEIVDSLKMRLGPYAWSGQQMQNPVPRGGAIFKEEWFKLYGRPGEDPVEVKMKFPPFSHVAAFLDCALTDKNENDPSALLVLGTWIVPQTGAMAVMMINAWQDRLRINPLVVRVAGTCDKYHVDTLVIENKANGHSVEQELRRLYANAEWSVQFTDPTRQGEKVARAHSVTHLFEEGMVWYPNTDWAQMVIEQMCSFPKAAHDDLVDCATMGLRYFRERGILYRRPEMRQQEQSLASLARGQMINRPLYDS